MHDAQTISLRDVPTSLRLGVPPGERGRPQTVLVSVVMTLLEPPAFAPDAPLSETIDYDTVIGFIRDTLPGAGEIALIEAVADAVAGFCLSLSPRIVSADVTVKKPSVLEAPGLVAVTIRRASDPGRRRQALHVAGE